MDYSRNKSGHSMVERVVSRKIRVSNLISKSKGVIPPVGIERIRLDDL